MGSELYAYFDVKARGSVHSEQLDELADDAGLEEVPGAGARRRRAARRHQRRPKPASEVELVLDTSQIKLFDPERRPLAHRRQGLISRP